MSSIFLHELKYYFKNPSELIYIYGFFFLFIVIAPFGLRGELHLLPELSPILILLSLLASLSLGAQNLFQRDADSGVLELYQQLPTSLYSVVLGKWLAFALATLVPLVAAIPCYLALGGLPWAWFAPYSLALLAAGTAFSILCCLAGLLTVGLERGRAVSLLIVLPLSVPIIIFGSQYLQSPEPLWQSELTFLIAYSIFLLPLICLAGAGCIRASN